MDLNQLSLHLEGKIPPLDSWDPPFCGDMPIEIKKDGRWYYMDSEITRLSLVKLFATVLIKEGADYFLKTPVEKVRIKVEDAPFMITSWQLLGADTGQVMSCIDNLDRKHLLNDKHPLSLKQVNNLNLPYLCLHHGLTAKISRNVYYQWADLAQEINGEFFIHSANKKYKIG